MTARRLSSTLFASLIPILALCLPLTPAHAVTITWTGSVSSSWHTPGNWDLNRVPGSGDDVVINDMPGSASINYTTGTTFIRSLTCNENFTMSGGVLSLDAASSFGQSFTFSSAEIRGAGALTINGFFNWGAQGLMNGTGLTTISPGVNWLCNIMQFTSTLLTRPMSNYGNGMKSGPGTFSIQSPGVFRNRSGGTFDLSNGSVTGTGAFENQAGSLITHSSGMVSISTELSNPGTIRVTGGILSILGNFHNYAGQTLTGGTYDITGSLRIQDADIRTNLATIILNGTLSAIADQMGTNALANLTSNDIGASFSVTNGRQFTTAALFTNKGAVTVGPMASSRLIANTGYRQIAGTTTLDNGGLASSAFIDILGGVLGGNGIILGNVINGGVVSPGASPGMLNVTGNYTQTAGGTFSVEIGGTSSGTQYDFMSVSGTVSLNGTLSANLIFGYSPVPPDNFTILTSSALIGNFTSYTPIMSGANCVMTSYSPTTVVLETVPCATADVPATSGPATPGRMALWPNPLRSGELLRIRLSTPGERVIGLELFDVAGRRLVAAHSEDFPIPADGEIHWNPGPVAPGIYFVKSRAASGSTEVSRIAVVR